MPKSREARVDPYVRELSREPLLTAAEEVELGRRIRLGDAAARERMIAANLRLAWKMAFHWPCHGLSRSDVVQLANIGLIQAADRFDPERNVRFSTYASYWISQSIWAGLVDNGLIHVPAYIREQLSRLRRMYGPDPSDWPGSEDELRSVLGISRFKAGSVRCAQSIAAATFERLSVSPRNDVPVASTVDPIVLGDDVDALSHALAKLSPRRREVLVRRYGIGYPPHTLKAVGSAIGLVKERVRQIEAEAIAELRAMMGSDRNGGN